jgi:hypothetical protein
VGVRTRTTSATIAAVVVDLLPNLFAKWKGSQKKAITNLKSRCGKRAFGLVKDIQTIDDLFEMLKVEFKPKGEGVFNEVYNRWEDVSLAECKDVNDYCTQFDQIRTELTDLDPECEFPRAILVKKFLKGLGPTLNNWEMSFNQQHSIIGDSDTPGITLLNKALAMMGGSELSKKHWPEAVIHANYLRSRSPVGSLKITLFEAVTGRIPDLSHIRVFSCKVWYRQGS